ncbi:hypothetical protein FOTG_09528 [Fusarium oxysporum f. sp. vasinfectum 25433]|uniref:Uncharacterized protein n=1 Tax=Fusarium oxysporum f. sp. vasinfectum 25433 TaxID=1089449 RepID=X0LP05_FUSOX|nr:hypothetical protein FOTG_09528 [Fusarium oxysporum f. sp. vasinfectum 25433]
MKARVKLEKEEEQAEKALKAAMAKLARICSQKRLLKKKGDKLFTCGMQSQEESSEIQNESATISNAQSLGAVDMIDWNSILGDVLFELVDKNSLEVIRH